MKFTILFSIAIQLIGTNFAVADRVTGYPDECLKTVEGYVNIVSTQASGPIPIPDNRTHEIYIATPAGAFKTVVTKEQIQKHFLRNEYIYVPGYGGVANGLYSLNLMVPGIGLTSIMLTGNGKAPPGESEYPKEYSKPHTTYNHMDFHFRQASPLSDWDSAASDIPALVQIPESQALKFILRGKSQYGICKRLMP